MTATIAVRITARMKEPGSHLSTKRLSGRERVCNIVVVLPLYFAGKSGDLQGPG